jgi:hypothetical protein
VRLLVSGTVVGTIAMSDGWLNPEISAAFTVAPRAFSPRQFPTDHIHAASTREYQNDQSSLLFLAVIGLAVPTTTGDLTLISNRQISNIDRSLHIRTTASTRIGPAAGCSLAN